MRKEFTIHLFCSAALNKGMEQYFGLFILPIYDFNGEFGVWSSSWSWGYIYGCSLCLFVHCHPFGCKSQRGSAKAWRDAGGMEFHGHGGEFGGFFGVQSGWGAVGWLGRLGLQSWTPSGSAILHFCPKLWRHNNLTHPPPGAGWEKAASWIWN